MCGGRLEMVGAARDLETRRGIEKMAEGEGQAAPGTGVLSSPGSGSSRNWVDTSP